jgi:hypothetical protein
MNVSTVGCTFPGLYPAAPVGFDTVGSICETQSAASLAETSRLVSRAEVAELADARGSGPRTRKGVGVRVPSSAPSCQVNPIKSIYSTSYKQ